MSVNDYAAHQAHRLKIDKPASQPERTPPPVDHGTAKPADPMGVEESALTDTFIGKMKKFWGTP